MFETKIFKTPIKNLFIIVVAIATTLGIYSSQADQLAEEYNPRLKRVEKKVIELERVKKDVQDLRKNVENVDFEKSALILALSEEVQRIEFQLDSMDNVHKNDLERLRAEFSFRLRTAKLAAQVLKKKSLKVVSSSEKEVLNNIAKASIDKDRLAFIKRAAKVAFSEEKKFGLDAVLDIVKNMAKVIFEFTKAFGIQFATEIKFWLAQIGFTRALPMKNFPEPKLVCLNGSGLWIKQRNSGKQTKP